MSFQRIGFAAWAPTLLFLLAATPASAVIPTGSFELALFLGQSVWLDVNEGENEFCEGFAEGFGSMPQQCEFEMFVDAKGKITGSLAIVAENTNVGVELTGPIKGKLKGNAKSGLTELSFSAKISGEASDGSALTTLSSDVSFEGQISPAGSLTGEWSTKFCSKAAGCLEEVDTAAPEMLTGGGWTLRLEIADLGGGKLGGSAAAELGDGTQCPYSISGKWSSSSDVASLKLSPTSEACAKTSISLKDVQLATFLTAQLKYKLFGQQGDTPVESVDR